MMSNEPKDPISAAEVKSSPDKLKWEKMMGFEMKSLHLNEVGELAAEPPPTVGNK